MNTFCSALWRKFRKSKQYREEFVSAQVKRGIPFQIRAMMKRRGLSQEELADRSGLTQGVVSRAANPNYGNLTLNTIIRIAAGFDVAFVGQFVPFSKLEGWFDRLDQDAIGEVDSFPEEDEHVDMTVAEKRNTAVIIFPSSSTLPLNSLVSSHVARKPVAFDNRNIRDTVETHVS